MNLSLHFDKGTVLLYGVEKGQLPQLEGVVWDERTFCYRTTATQYRQLVTTLREQNISFQDHARKFSVETFHLKKKDHAPRVPAGGCRNMDVRTARCCDLADRSRENNSGCHVDRKNWASHFDSCADN